jgi:hypothetical protein
MYDSLRKSPPTPLFQRGEQAYTDVLPPLKKGGWGGFKTLHLVTLNDAPLFL